MPDELKSQLRGSMFEERKLSLRRRMEVPNERLPHRGLPRRAGRRHGSRSTRSVNLKISPSFREDLAFRCVPVPPKCAIFAQASGQGHMTDSTGASVVRVLSGGSRPCANGLDASGRCLAAQRRQTRDGDIGPGMDF